MLFEPDSFLGAALERAIMAQPAGLSQADPPQVTVHVTSTYEGVLDAFMNATVTGGCSPGTATLLQVGVIA